MAITVAITIPETKPMAALTSVVPSAPKLAARASAADSDAGRMPRAGVSANRYCHDRERGLPDERRHVEQREQRGPQQHQHHDRDHRP